MQQYDGPGTFIDPRNPFQKATRLLRTQQNILLQPAVPKSQFPETRFPGVGPCRLPVIC